MATLKVLPLPGEENFLHNPNLDPECIVELELEDSSSQRAVNCSCGFKHPIRTEGEIDLTLGYKEEEKKFRGLFNYNGLIIFTHHHPHYHGKL